MFLFDLIIAALFVGMYLWFLKSNQSNVFFSSLSMLVSVFAVKQVTEPVFSYLETNGWVRDNYTVTLIYIVLLILLWGLIYAITTNFNFKSLEKYRSAVSLLSGLIMLFALSIMSCFVLQSFGASVHNSVVCRVCSKFSDGYKIDRAGNAVVSKDINQVYLLPKAIRVLNEDNSCRSDIVNKINQERSMLKRSVLKEDIELRAFGKTYAQKMVETQRFAHYDINQNGPEQRAAQAKINYTFLGENLALAPDSITAHEAFMASTRHRNNILSTRYDKIGVACLRLSDDSLIITEEFSGL